MVFIIAINIDVNVKIEIGQEIHQIRPNALIIRKSLFNYKQQNALTEAKKNIPEFKAVHSQVLQDALKRLDRAFKMRQERQFGFPRFKKVGRYRSFVSR